MNFFIIIVFQRYILTQHIMYQTSREMSRQGCIDPKNEQWNGYKSAAQHKKITQIP